LKTSRQERQGKENASGSGDSFNSKENYRGCMKAKVSKKKVREQKMPKAADIEKAMTGEKEKPKLWFAQPEGPAHRRPEVIHSPEEIPGIRADLEAVPLRKPLKGKEAASWIYMGIPGLDDMFEKGIPRGSSVLIAGGAGSGKTIMCLQTLAYGCSKGDKCIFLSFEESEERLKQHMRDFGWDPDKYIKQGKLVLKRLDAFEIARSVEALLAKARGELLIDFEGIPGLLPKHFIPDRIVLDSLTAVAAAFVGKEEGYRSYISQLFRMLEKLGTTSFLVTETEQIPTVFSPRGVEEFLADGVIALYAVRKDSLRVNGVEVIKMRGTKHDKRLIPFNILQGKGIVAYPREEIFVTVG